MPLVGRFAPPGDKSISHRVGLLSLLGRGRCQVGNFSNGRDCASTLEAVRALGGGVESQGEHLVLSGAGGRLKREANLDCGNSGTTLRLLMGLLAGSSGRFGLDGDQSLRKRPMERVATPLRQMGARIDTTEGRPPVRITGGGLAGIDYRLPVASAQLKSALLLAGLQAEGPTTVREPAPSRDHTERLLRMAGADISRVDGGWQVRPSRLSLPERLWVPGDSSSAAFFLCAAAMWPGSDVTAESISLNPTRTGFLAVLGRMGAAVETKVDDEAPEPWGRVRVRYRGGLRACVVERREIPLLVDEVPILALTATQAEGVTVFQGVEELRVKESNRIAAVISQLGAMGATLREEGDDLLVSGPTRLQAPAALESFGDHRIAMILRLAVAMCGGDSQIHDEACAAISYPGFAQTLRELAG